MKRFIALLLTLSALLSLAACGAASTNTFALAEARYPESAPYPDETKYSGLRCLER